MVMLSESQSGNLNGSPLQCLQFPTMTISQNIVKTKLKIIIASKKVEDRPRTESCEFGQRMFINGECNHNVSVNENKKSVKNKRHKVVLHSSDDPKLYSPANPKVKLAMPGSNKRVSPGILDSQKEKRRKMDRSVKQQCGSILKTLMTHRSGWVFNTPVDPVALHIPDYFSIITEPMDLGTIKTNLDDDRYFSFEEFAADVRLTFTNAMQYNPPSNNVHVMAKELDNIFNRRWKSLEAKWNRECKDVEQECILRGRATNTQDTRQTCHKKSLVHVSLLPKTSISADEKKRLRKELVEACRGKMTENLRSFLQKIGLICQESEKIEMDIDTFDDQTLWELKRVIKGTTNVTAAKVDPAKMTQNCGHRVLGKIVHKGTDTGNRSACGSVNTKPPLSWAASKCGSCGSVTCQCSLQNDYAHASSSDLSSERSLGQDHAASKMDCVVKNLLTSYTSKSDPDSDGSLSALDEENFCRRPQPSTPATTAGSGDDWTPLIDVQLSPQKALRAAMLKSRFAETILKAKQKTLLDHGDNADPVRMQQEKERLERQQREEKARIEAQIKAAEAASRLRAEAEWKMQREREREAARIALQKMEKTVEIDNLEILKDLELLSGGPVSDHLLDGEDGSEVILGTIKGGHFGNPLEQLGLFIKEDYIGDEDEDEVEGILNPDGEEGEIFS